MAHLHAYIIEKCGNRTLEFNSNQWTAVGKLQELVDNADIINGHIKAVEIFPNYYNEGWNIIEFECDVKDSKVVMPVTSNYKYID